jgi:recombination protein RecT
MGQLAQAQATQGAQLTRAQPQNDFKSLLMREWPRIQAVMPKKMDPDRMFQLAVSAYNTTPLLAQCSTVSMLSCIMKCASLGLEPSAVDGLGRAYILPYKNRKTGRHEAQMIIGYRGMIDLARRSGELVSIHAQAVYEGDRYRHWEDETGQHFTFEPGDVEHAPDKLTDVYVCAHLKDGGFVFETMTRREVDAVRGRSRASQTGPWVTDYEAMALKTVIRRSFKYLPVSVEAQQAAASDETTPDYSSILNPVIQEASEAPEALPVGVDTETGEIVADSSVSTSQEANDGDAEGSEQ